MIALNSLLNINTKSKTFTSTANSQRLSYFIQYILEIEEMYLLQFTLE